MIELSPTDPDPVTHVVAVDRRHAWFEANSSVVTWAAITWGGALAVIVGHEGEWRWILTRLAVVGVLLSMLLWAVQHRCCTVTGAMTAGLVGVVVGGGIGVPHVLRSGDVVLTTAGLMALLSGSALVVCAATSVLRGRGILGRAVGALAFVIVAGLVALIFVPAVMATNVPATELDDDDPATFGLSFENVTFETSDGVTVSAWYVPSENDAAVVMRHGAGSTRTDVLQHTIVLAGQGYGVLLADARGHGLSGGRAMDFGWFGDSDISAAVTFLTSRPDVDPARVGVVGMSMGGEEAIGAAASDPRIRAVVAEGVTGRTDADEHWLSDQYGVRGTVQEGMEWLRYSLADLLTSAPKPISLSDRDRTRLDHAVPTDRRRQRLRRATCGRQSRGVWLRRGVGVGGAWLRSHPRSQRRTDRVGATSHCLSRPPHRSGSLDPVDEGTLFSAPRRDVTECSTAIRSASGSLSHDQADQRWVQRKRILVRGGAVGSGRSQLSGHSTATHLLLPDPVVARCRVWSDGPRCIHLSSRRDQRQAAAHAGADQCKTSRPGGPRARDV